MSTSLAREPARGPSIVRILNPLIQRLLGAGMPFGPNVLLTVKGRTSGVPRTFPVAILASDGHRYIQSPFGEVNWVRNLRADGAAVVSKGRRREEVEAFELTPEAAAPIIRDVLVPQLRTPLGAASVGRYFHIKADATLDDLVAEARRHPMFELRPRTPVGEGGESAR